MRILLVAVVTIAAGLAADTAVVPLWPDGAPGSEGKTAEESVRTTPGGEVIVSGVHKPSIHVWLPSADLATGAAVVIAPGGGHRELWTTHEGTNVAKWLSDHGVAAFVLRYRLAREKGSTYTIEGHSLDDMRQAVRVVRQRAVEWRVDPGRVGVMGFSAGGELAALIADRGEGDRPAFQALIYPAIPSGMKLSAGAPPAFLVCGENDRPGISQGLAELYLAMKRAGIGAELHIYAGAGHGFGVRPTSKAAVSTWLVRFREWLVTTRMVAN
jgi:endo-1,4-beta-xylanase